MNPAAPPLKTSSMESISRKRYGPSKFQLQMDEARDAARTVTRCVDCRKVHRGTAEEGRQWHREHRTEEHGWKPKKRRR